MFVSYILIFLGNVLTKKTKYDNISLLGGIRNVFKRQYKKI